MFIATAVAETVNETQSAVQSTAALAAPSMSATITNMLPLLVIFGVFYFMLIRPQMKKQKEHQAMLNNLVKGDKVITNGGIIGTITKIETEAGVLHLEIAPSIKIRVLKNAVAELFDKGAAGDGKASSKAAEELLPLDKTAD